jgi:hypothetical protein
VFVHRVSVHFMGVLTKKMVLYLFVCHTHEEDVHSFFYGKAGDQNICYITIHLYLSTISFAYVIYSRRQKYP